MFSKDSSYEALIRHARISVVTLVLCGSAGGIMTLSALLPQLQLPLIGLGALLAGAGAVADSQRLRDAETLSTDDLISRQRRINDAYTAKPEGAASSESENTPAVERVEWFDWTRLTDESLRDQIPHLMIAGYTGSGKSTLARWLAGNDNGIVLAIDPHYQPGNFPTAQVVVGAGRRYGHDARPYDIKLVRGKEVVVGEPPVTFNQVLEGANPTVCQFVQSLLSLMDTRYTLLSRGSLDLGGEHPYVTVFADEYPAWGKLPGVRETMKQLILEARKVGIRIILITQGLQVKTLGFDGESDIRSNMVCVRIGEIALDHARRIGMPPGIQTELRRLGRYAGVIDDTPAEVPDLSLSPVSPASPTENPPENGHSAPSGDSSDSSDSSASSDRRRAHANRRVYSVTLDDTAVEDPTEALEVFMTAWKYRQTLPSSQLSDLACLVLGLATKYGPMTARECQRRSAAARQHTADNLRQAFVECEVRGYGWIVGEDSSMTLHILRNVLQ